MIANAYILLGVVAFAVTGLVVGGGRNGALTPEMGAVGSAVSLVLWGVFIQASFDVITYSGGTQFSHSYPELAMLGVIGGALSFLTLFRAALATIEEQ